MGDSHKCYTAEARKFEDLLNRKGISYDDFRHLMKSHNELSVGGKAEVADLLRTTDKE